MNLLLLTVVLIATALVSVSLFWVVHRHSSGNVFLTDTTRGAAVFGIVGTAFAVILAFVTLIGLQDYDSAASGAESEAVAVVEASRTAQLLAPVYRDEMQGAVMCYARSVVFDEWPRMRDDQRSPLVDHWVAHMRGIDARLPVTDLKDQSVLEHLLTTSDKRTDGRRERLSVAGSFIPAPVWFVLLLSGLITIGFVMIFKDRDEPFRVQGTLIGGVTVLVVAGLVMVWFLEHPYGNGSGSLKPSEMRMSIGVLATEAHPTAPCDPHGRPI